MLRLNLHSLSVSASELLEYGCMTLVCPAHISNCGQLFRAVGADQHSVADGGATHPEIYIRQVRMRMWDTQKYYKSDK